jgi:ribosome biogenesis GTPase
MELHSLGFDEWFQQKRDEAGRPEFGVARVSAVDRGNFLVRNQSGEVSAELSGRMLFATDESLDYPSVGDWVLVQYYNEDTFAIIDGLIPRKSVLMRKAAGKKVDYQVIAANLDAAFIMQACDGNFNLRRLERYLVMVYDGNIEPILLLSKSDLIGEDELEQKISQVREANIHCTIIAFSNESGAGLTEITQMLAPGKTYCLLGSSGVGKTTLLNRLVGREAFKTSLVREKDGKGRHTTTRRQLIVLDGGAMLIDTPGMRELGTAGAGAGIDESFEDILSLAESCRFNDCTHTKEIGCAVRAAVQAGEISQDRYLSYLKLQKESEHFELSYVERRKKDRKLGQYYKTVLKQRQK